MIRFDRVSKRYPGGVEALTELTFDLDAGEALVIGGHSGAGKTTLLKLVAAIERPTSGAVLVGRQNLGSLNRAALPYYRRRIGLVFQDQKLLFDRTAFDNVMLPLSIAGFTAKDAKARVRAALNKVGLGGRENAMPVALSGGEQQRLAIARAVVGRPDMLLADEPTAHLDADAATEVARILLEFNRVGVTLLVASYAGNLFPGMRRMHLSHGRQVT